MNGLKDRIALVTGASRGIGKFIAEALAAEGVHLSLAARNEAALETTAASLREQYQVRVLVVPTDVSVRSQLEQLVQRTQDELGFIDLLINNAALERMERFCDSDWDQTAMDLAVNVRGPMDLTRLILPGMIERDCGHIVNVASLAGFGAHAHAESYVTTKHAIIGFTRALRASLKAQQSQVSASSVCPGFVREVGMLPVNKRAQASSPCPSRQFKPHCRRPCCDQSDPSRRARKDRQSHARASIFNVGDAVSELGRVDHEKSRSPTDQPKSARIRPTNTMK